MEKEECLERLSDLIDLMCVMHRETGMEWAIANGNRLRNLNTMQVRDLEPCWAGMDAERYRRFLRGRDLDRFWPHIGDGFLVEYRIKTANSIDDKISRYNRGPDEGRISVRKCLNDIFGVRAVVDAELSFDNVRGLVEPLRGHVRCHDSSKAAEGWRYSATHVYIEGEDRRLFPWELQIWLSRDEASNFASHEACKQDYTGWEREVWP